MNKTHILFLLALGATVVRAFALPADEPIFQLRLRLPDVRSDAAWAADAPAPACSRRRQVHGLARDEQGSRHASACPRRRRRARDRPVRLRLERGLAGAPLRKVT